MNFNFPSYPELKFFHSLHLYILLLGCLGEEIFCQLDLEVYVKLNELS